MPQPLLISRSTNLHAGLRRLALASTLFLLGWGSLSASTVARQPAGVPPDSVAVLLAPVLVEATRMPGIPVLSDLALVSFERPAIVRDVALSRTLASLLRTIPGLLVEDRGHLALGERVIVRGMGARASFGVRGVHLLLDGVSLTMPDGQAVTDIVEPALVRRVEVIRGPSGRLWGNGSGGVVALRTAATAGDPPGVLVRAEGGAYGRRKLVAESVIGAGARRLHAFVSDTRTDGYREHAGGRVSRAGLHGTVITGRSVLRIGLAAADQDVRHPGSLTTDEFAADPSAADSRYVSTASGKRSRQLQAAARWTTPAGGGALDIDLFGVTRDLDNALPFAWIGLDRIALGTRLGWSAVSGPWTLRLGVDGSSQVDDRVNTDNAGGQRGEETVLDQRERVRSVSGAAGLRWEPSGRIGVSAGLRVDRYAVRLFDRIYGDGDQSSQRRFTAMSPGVSIRWAGSGWTAHAGWSTAFDMPTTTELVNSPDGSPGFNRAVDPQHVRGFEAGIRTARNTWGLDVSAYALTIHDLLTGAQDEETGRTYFTNAGSADHHGVDVRSDWSPSDRLRLSMAASLQRFRFGPGDLSGNRVPGLPERRIELTIESGSDRARAQISLLASGARFGDDANQARIDGFVVVGVRAHHQGILVGGTIVRPFAGIENMFDRRYVGSVVVNARGGRFVEPGAGRSVTAGLSARLGFR